MLDKMPSTESNTVRQSGIPIQPQTSTNQTGQNKTGSCC